MKKTGSCKQGSSHSQISSLYLWIPQQSRTNDTSKNEYTRSGLRRTEFHAKKNNPIASFSRYKNPFPEISGKGLENLSPKPTAEGRYYRK